MTCANSTSKSANCAPILWSALTRRRRESPHGLLDLPARAKLLALVEHRPGARMAEIVRALSMSWSAVYHHLQRLREAGLVRIEVRGRYRQVYPLARPSLEGEPKALRGATRVRVARVIALRGPLSTPDLIEATGLTRRLAYHHVRGLEEDGLIVRARGPGRAALLYPTPALVDALAFVSG